MNICHYTPLRTIELKGINERFDFAYKNICYLFSNGLGSVYTSNNGIHKSTATNFQLGGSLIVDTTIDVGSSNTRFLNITGANPDLLPTTTGNVVRISNTAGGSALLAYSYGGNSALAANFNVSTPSAANTVIPSIIVSRDNSVATTAGVGVAIQYRVQSDLQATGGPLSISNNLISKWLNVNSGTRLSEFSINGIDNVTTNSLLALIGTGQAVLPKYGSGNFTGTATYGLSVDSSGHLIETTGGGGGGNTIYSADDSLASNRIVSLNGKTLDFKDAGGNALISLDPITFSSGLLAKDGTNALASLTLSGKDTVLNRFELSALTSTATGVNITGDAITGTIFTTGSVNSDVSAGSFLVQDTDGTKLSISTASSELRDYNNTGDGRTARFIGTATTTDATTVLEANFEGGTKVATITAFADTSLSSITSISDVNYISAVSNINLGVSDLVNYAIADITLTGIDLSSDVGYVQLNGVNLYLTSIVAKNYLNDGAAAAAGVGVGGVYHTAGALKIRLT